MKKWISLLFVTVLILFANVGGAGAAASKSAAVTPKLYLDGKALQANVPPVMSHASVLVPIRTVAENLGYKVSYDKKKKLVTVEEGSTKIQMTLGKAKASVNGKSVTMTEPPLLQSDTTLIPIRFVGETFGLQILWDNASKSAYLYADAASGHIGTGSGNGGNAGTDTGAGVGNNAGAGAGTGNDSGNGSGTVPSDGGLIGVVDGTDGNNGTNGNNGTDGTGDPNGSATPTPAGSNAHLHQIRYAQDEVVITYDGLTIPTSHILSGPDRIVIDLPNAEFAADFQAEDVPVFTEPPAIGEITEFAVSGHDALQNIRFAQYQNNVVRVVLDLNQPWGYELVNNLLSREIHIRLKQQQTPAPQPGNGRYTVVLDAGHGGSDPGAGSVTGKWEKEFNLSVVLKVRALLAKESRINLVMTRTSDTYPTLDDRVNLANSLKANLFLSVHGNSFYKATNGTETYYTRANSLAFAKVLHKNTVAATGFKDNGVRTAGFKVIKYTTMPAVLLEVGYLSNVSNGKQMFNDAFQNRVAAAIAASIKQYLHV